MILHSNFYDLVLSYGDDVPTLNLDNIDTSYLRLYSFFWVVVFPPLDILMLHPHTSLLHILM